ncbi:MAG: hypothetical protein JW820_20160 [Spirochaetales bacterium]|nr:hypothetical protein [Spirochaetales bacterium]
MNRIRCLAPVLLLVLIAAGCSDLSVFSPSGEGAAVIEVRSLNEGGVMRAGESLSFVIHDDAGATDDLQLEIILTDAEGNSVWNRTLSDPPVNEELELLLPELEPGQYEILLRVGAGGSATSQQELSFFFVRGDYAVAGMSSYPPSTLPGAEILIQTDLEVPEGADPYIRWTQGDAILARGLLSEGLDAITWKAPREPGVYPVTVELFPVPPAGGADYTFSSALAMTARLYISAGASASAHALVPEASYYSLFHFDGTLQDRGQLRTGTEGEAGAGAELFGSAAYVPGIPSDGLSIRAGSGMRYPRLILPLSEAESPSGAAARAAGSLAPCTLTLALIPDGEPREATLLTTRSSNGRFGLILRFDAQGLLIATVRSADSAADLPSGIPALAAGVLQRVDLSLMIRGDTLTALWFLDGRQTAAVARMLPLREVGRAGAAGETVIGGVGGFAGTVAELGVYFQDDQGRPAVDPGIYRAAMRKRFAASLILAEGFEGLYPPAGFVLEGRTILEEGALILSSGPAAGEKPAAEVPAASGLNPAASAPRMETPLFERRLPGTIIELQTRSGFPAGSRIVLRWEGEKDGFAEIRAEGGEAPVSGLLLDPRAPGGAAALPRLPEGLLIRLSRDTLTVRPLSGGPDEQGQPASLPIGAATELSSWLTLSLVGPAGDTPLQLDHIVIYGTSER